MRTRKRGHGVRLVGERHSLVVAIEL